MEQVEIEIEIELEDGVHSAKIIGSQAAVDAIVSALEGDAEEVEAVEVVAESEGEEPEAEGEAA